MSWLLNPFDFCFFFFFLFVVVFSSALGIEDADSAHRQIVSIITIKDVSHALHDFSRLLTPVETYTNEIRVEDLVSFGFFHCFSFLV